MHQPKIAFTSSAALLALLAGLGIQTAHAQDLPNTIASCAEVQCPAQGGGAQCRIIDTTFTAVGVARIPLSSPALSNGLSWVQGVGVREGGGGRDRTFDKNFYLATSQDVNLATGTGACAVFFTQVSKAVSFGEGDLSVTQGTCETALSRECVDALVGLAKALDVKGLSSEEACGKLEAQFRGNLDGACARFATGDRWAGIVAKPLTGPRAAQRITPAQNGSTNCWPINPKLSDLALVEAIQTKGDMLSDTVQANFFNITPILTLFYAEGQGVVAETEAQMTCMKAIGRSTTSAANENKNAAGVLRFEVSVASYALVGVFAFFLSY